MRPWSVYIGFEPRESDAFAVCRHSIVTRASQPIDVHGLVLADLQARGLYTREVEHRDGRLFDPISGHPMATEFAISRFLVPHLAGAGWAMFLDCDMLVLEDLSRLFESLHPKFAAYCVKHNHRPAETVKMDGQVQSAYDRKNWSSVIVFNCDHPSNKRLTVEYVNSVPGRDLHRLAWLQDEEIGELDPTWNWLVGHTKPKIIHFTDGIPSMKGYENSPWAEEWREELRRWAARG